VSFIDVTASNVNNLGIDVLAQQSASTVSNQVVSGIAVSTG
jgi:hypothetical protein